MTGRLTQAQDQLDKLQAEHGKAIGALQQQLTALDAEADAIVQQLDAATLEDDSGELARMEARLALLRRELPRRRDAYAERRAAITAAERELADATAERDQLERRRAELISLTGWNLPDTLAGWLDELRGIRQKLLLLTGTDPGPTTVIVDGFNRLEG